MLVLYLKYKKWNQTPWKEQKGQKRELLLLYEAKALIFLMEVVVRLLSDVPVLCGILGIQVKNQQLSLLSTAYGTFYHKWIILWIVVATLFSLTDCVHVFSNCRLNSNCVSLYSFIQRTNVWIRGSLHLCAQISTLPTIFNWWATMVALHMAH